MHGVASKLESGSSLAHEDFKLWKWAVWGSLLQCGPGTTNVSFTWGFLINVHSQIPPRPAESESLESECYSIAGLDIGSESLELHFLNLLDILSSPDELNICWILRTSTGNLWNVLRTSMWWHSNYIFQMPPPLKSVTKIPFETSVNLQPIYLLKKDTWQLINRAGGQQSSLTMDYRKTL